MFAYEKRELEVLFVRFTTPRCNYREKKQTLCPDFSILTARLANAFLGSDQIKVSPRVPLWSVYPSCTQALSDWRHFKRYSEALILFDLVR